MAARQSFGSTNRHGMKRAANHEADLRNELKKTRLSEQDEIQKLRAKVRELEAQNATFEKLTTNLRQNAKEREARSVSERILQVRLAQKEQEVQDQLARNAELTQALAPTTLQMRAALLDPLVNNLFHRVKAELLAYKEKAEEARSEVEATEFTPNSETGKRLLTKCRTLVAENEELGKKLSEGRIADMEAELTLQKRYIDQLKAKNEELQAFIGQLDDEQEGMQAAILHLHHQNVELTRERDELRASIEGRHTVVPSRTVSAISAAGSVEAEGITDPSDQRRTANRRTHQATVGTAVSGTATFPSGSKRTSRAELQSNVQS